jgi:hypothetical protein
MKEKMEEYTKICPYCTPQHQPDSKKNANSSNAPVIWAQDGTVKAFNV